MNDWTDDIKKLMDGYEVKAPEGLLEEVKKRLDAAPSLPPAPSKGGGDAEVPQYQADHRAKVVEKGDGKAEVVPLWRYRWIAAAAVAVIAVLVCWKLLPKVSKEREPLALSSTSHRHAGASSSSSVSPSSIAMLSSHVGVGPAVGGRGAASGGRGSVSRNSVAASPALAAPPATGDEAAVSQPAATSQPATSNKKRVSKERRSVYNSFDSGYDLAYEPSAKGGGSWTMGAYYGGASGNGGGSGMDMPFVASDAMASNAAPYGVYPANMATSDGFVKLASVPKKKAHHKQPIKAGVSVGYRINNRWSVQTGVTYSYLSSDFTSDYSPKETQKLHYVGVPLTASYDIVKSRKASVYVTGGGEVEKLVKGKTSMENGEEHDVKEHRPQWSVKAAVGGAYHITPALSVYVEPGVSHHFDNHSAVENVYKDRPTSFSLNMGFRVNLNEK